MKRLRLVTATGAVILVGLLLPSVGQAAPAPSGLSIKTNARLISVPVSQVNVGFRAICTGGSGLVFMNVTQHAPENTFTASGDGITGVVCDGQWHDAAVTVTDASVGFFDVGRALAVGTLVAPSGNVTEAKEIEIRL